jgi:hypothetical protein
MFKLTRWIIWGFLTLLLLTLIDQTLLRVDLPIPGYAEVHKFYRDFRSRLLGLVDKDPVARVISTTKEAALAEVKKAPTTGQKVLPRFLYVDSEGALQFADSLDLVPLQYRRDAQPLAE